MDAVNYLVLLIAIGFGLISCYQRKRIGMLVDLLQQANERQENIERTLPDIKLRAYNEGHEAGQAFVQHRRQDAVAALERDVQNALHHKAVKSSLARRVQHVVRNGTKPYGIDTLPRQNQRIIILTKDNARLVHFRRWKDIPDARGWYPWPK